MKSLEAYDDPKIVQLTDGSKLDVSADTKPPLPSASTTAKPPSNGLYSMARKHTPSNSSGTAITY